MRQQHLIRKRVEVTEGFLLLIAWLNYLDRSGVVFQALIACAIHEAGHFLAIKMANTDIKSFRITAIGAEIKISGSMTYWREAVAALAGPGMNLFLALLFSINKKYTLFVGLNLALGCFNMMPISCLDGGRALSCILSVLVGPEQTHRIAQILDRMILLLLSSAGITAAIRWGNGTLLLVVSWMISNGIRQKRRE